MIIFEEFSATNKAEWLSRISKELKDKTLEDLTWRPGGGLEVDPFAHADDFGDLPFPLDTGPNDWQINEDIVVTDVGVANQIALEALKFGADSLRFEFAEAPSERDFLRLFDGIFPDYIALNFAGRGVTQSPSLFLAFLDNLAKERGLSTHSLRGSLSYDPIAQTPPGTQPDWRYLADLLDFGADKFPNFALIEIDGRGDYASPEDVVGELSAILEKGNRCIEKLAERGISPEKSTAAMQFRFFVGQSYCVEIAKIRSLKLLWLNVLQSWGATLRYPFIDIGFAPANYTDALYTNMIRATTMCMSAAIGGASRISVLPYDAERESQAVYSQDFARRIARNVQHLLKMEGHLHEVADPAAGSFYIEKLTKQIAEKTWSGIEC